MPGTITSDTVGRPPAPPENGFGGDGWRPDWGGSRRASFTGLLVLVGATTMVFAALTTIFLARHENLEYWPEIQFPPLVWANTIMLLISSGFIEMARHRLKSGRRTGFNGWWTAGTACGAVFLTCQAIVWRDLQTAGMFAPGNPSSAFFLLLTAVHALHLLGAMIVLLYVDVNSLRFRLGPARRTAADVSAVFWHFLDGLWVYLLVLFSVWT
jgi:cytochrome c oxidase subunit 3